MEAALTEHPAVAEAAVVGIPHDVKGNCLYCFVTLKQGHEGSDALAKELKTIVRTRHILCDHVHDIGHHVPYPSHTNTPPQTGPLPARRLRRPGPHPVGAGPAQDQVSYTHTLHTHAFSPTNRLFRLPPPHATRPKIKKRSGKVMRRILRKVAAAGKDVKPEELGDTTTLAEPEVVQELIANHVFNK